MDINKIIQELFPYPDITTGRGGMEINGLPVNALPHGRVVLMFTPDSARDRTFYLMETSEGVFVLLRICRAMGGTRYPRFAVIHKLARNNVAIEDIKLNAVRWASQI